MSWVYEIMNAEKGKEKAGENKKGEIEIITEKCVSEYWLGKKMGMATEYGFGK